MERLGQILSRGPSQEPEELRAASAVATANERLQHTFHFSPDEARVVSLRRGVLQIEVEHGAVGGIIVRQSKKLITDINRSLERRFGPASPRVSRVVTRQS